MNAGDVRITNARCANETAVVLHHHQRGRATDCCDDGTQPDDHVPPPPGNQQWLPARIIDCKPGCGRDLLPRARTFKVESRNNAQAADRSSNEVHFSRRSVHQPLMRVRQHLPRQYHDHRSGSRKAEALCRNRTGGPGLIVIQKSIPFSHGSNFTA